MKPLSELGAESGEGVWLEHKQTRNAIKSIEFTVFEPHWILNSLAFVTQQDVLLRCIPTRWIKI